MLQLDVDQGFECGTKRHLWCTWTRWHW